MTELIFKCQQKLVINLTGHPVNDIIDDITLKRVEKVPVRMTGRTTQRKRKSALEQMSKILSPLTSGDMGVWWAPLIKLSAMGGNHIHGGSSGRIVGLG